MRIIKEGTPPHKEKKQECVNCGCVFMYERSDIHTDKRDGDFVICPSCGAYINLINHLSMEKKEAI